MERPDGHDYHSIDVYLDDLESYRDQLEADKKELIEDSLHFAEWIESACVRNGRRTWTYRADNYSENRSTKEMFNIWKDEVNKLKE